MRIFLSFILILLANVSYCQFENTDVGARPAGLNGAFTSLADNSLAIFYNPAGLSQMKDREVSFFYSPAPYGLTELSSAAVTYAEPTKYGTFGAAVKTYGYELYREINGLVSYGNNYKGKIYYGANLNIYHLAIQNYNSATAFGVDFGALAKLTDFLQWGFYAKNLTGSTIGQSKEKIAQVFRTGFTFKPRGDLNLILETEKDVKYAFSFRGAFEYSPVQFFQVRAGIGSEPTTFAAGAGFRYSIFQLDYGFQNNSDLGFTHQAALTINFGGLKK